VRDTVLYFVIPCYNEEEVLLETSRRLYSKVKQLVKAEKISSESHVLFVNDGSEDKTWEIIERLHKWNPVFSGLSLSRNRGHQNALLAGLLYARDNCDVSVSMDADLQDDVEAVDEMLSRFEGGCDIVYGVRNDRASDTWFKRTTARGFYGLMHRMGVDMVSDHADYRLMSRRALIGLTEFREVNLFLRGIVPMIGYKSDKVYYKRGERFAGESKYPLSKMIRFSIEGITSLSIEPIRLITNTGLFVFLVSLCFLVWGIVQKIRGVTVAGWPSLIVSIWAIGGLILLSIGVIGEYIGKIYLETKGRPRFLIDKVVDDGISKVDGPTSPYR
jgi:glycosyltransferase involved in cell wall biosynthesis